MGGCGNLSAPVRLGCTKVMFMSFHGVLGVGFAV